MMEEKLLAAFLIISLNIIVVLIICTIGIKLSKINAINIIYIKQYLISTISTVLICCFLPTIITVIPFIILFFLYRHVIFKKYSILEQKIYTTYNGEIQFCKPIKHFSEIFYRSPKINNLTKQNKEYLYSFSLYLNNSIYIFIFYCVKGPMASECTVLYGIEFYIAIFALFIVFEKFIYHITLYSPTSPFSLCPTLAYIPTICSGIVFLTIATIMFISTI